MNSDQPLSYAAQHQKEFVEDLKKLVAIPSVSFPGFDPANVVASAEAVAGLLRRRGLENVEILTIPGCHPYVYGDWLHAPGAPTLLMYAHHDVQPAGRTELWKSPPFVATERDGRLWGRGSADDKAGVVVTASAIDAYLRTHGKLPVNIKVIIEGEEEIGSEHLEAFLQKYKSKMAADIMILTDTGNYDTGVPSITTALRGLISLDVTVRSADHPLHSGMWGGALVDPVQALAKMIASVTDKDGRIAIPGFYAKVRKLGRAEEKSLKALKYTEKDFRKQSGVLPKTKLLGGKDLLRSNWYQPSYSVNAIQASTRKDCANIINEAAWCHMGLRIVENMDPKETLKKFKAHLLKNAPWGVTVEFAGESTRAPGQLPQRTLEFGLDRMPVQPVGQHADLGDTTAEFVVEIARDASALLFEGMFLLQALQPRLKPLVRPIPRQPHHQPGEGHDGGGLHPPPLPPGGRNDQRQRHPSVVPLSVLIGGDHAQRIFSRR